MPKCARDLQSPGGDQIEERENQVLSARELPAQCFRLRKFGYAAVAGGGGSAVLPLAGPGGREGEPPAGLRE